MNDTFSANSLRLTPTQWLIALAIVLVAVILLPIWADNAEPFTPAESYRLPFATSEDYWTYHRLTKWTQQKNRALVIGDSVIWGEYVTPSQTLTHYLGPQYVNGGLPGAYPLALEGLVRHYCDVRKSKVILHLNLLWLSSKERDLQIKGTPFNHPRLLAQFDSPPAYEASISEQLGVTVDRHLPIRRWVHHLRITRFEGHDIHTWSMEHPYRNPLRVEPVALSDKARHDDRSWKQRGIERQDISWLTLDSQQWQAFTRTVQLLRDRNNEVFVIVGPFNTHLLTDESRRRYDRLKSQALKWLREQNVAHHDAKTLPSEEYADASHPLAQGYRSLANELRAVLE